MKSSRWLPYLQDCWRDRLLPKTAGILNTHYDCCFYIAWCEVYQGTLVQYKHAVSSYNLSLCQEKWNNETHNNKLHHFQPLIGITPLSGVYCHQDETVLRQCHIGHTFYTHSYILKGEDRPRCVGCDEDITVKHILLDCVDFSDQRLRFYSLPNLKHLFTQVPGHQIQ